MEYNTIKSVAYLTRRGSLGRVWWEAGGDAHRTRGLWASPALKELSWVAWAESLFHESSQTALLSSPCT